MDPAGHMRRKTARGGETLYIFIIYAREAQLIEIVRVGDQFEIRFFGRF